MTPLPIANGFYKSSSLPLSAQECVNWYPNIPDAPSLNDAVLFGTPGLEQKLTTSSLSTNANRGSRTMGQIPYFVNGGNLYSVDSSFSATDRGAIAGSGNVCSTDNGTNLMILSPGGTGYAYSVSGGLSPISDADFTTTNGAPQYCTWVDGYFIASTDEKKIIASALNDPTSWAGTDFTTPEADPDAIARPVRLSNQLFVFGTRTIEGYQNIGSDGFPFQRTGQYFEIGCTAPASMTEINGNLLFLGAAAKESSAVWAFNGTGRPEKVSTEAIEDLLEDLTVSELAAVSGYSYAQKGGYFACFNLPSTTIVYDLKTRLWHERKSQIISPAGDVSTQRCRVNSLTEAYGGLLVGDSQDGRIGQVKLDTYTEYASTIIRTAATQPFQNNMKSFFVPRIELTMESGVGNSADTDPQVSMRRSLDGKTFTQPLARSMGAVGRYGQRQIWTKCGRAERFETFKFSMSAPVKPVILQLTAQITPGTH